MTDLGPLNYFLGILIVNNDSGLFLSQSKYATEILERAHKINCNPCRKPIDSEKKLGPDGPPIADPTFYCSLTGALQYLTFTRPDLSYAVQQLCLYIHDPREPHLNDLKRVLRYVCGTTELSVQLYRSSTSKLTAYCNADWASCPNTRRSTFGYYVFLGDNILSWSSNPSDTTPFHAPVLKPNIAGLLMPLLRHHGFVTYYGSFTHLFIPLLWSIVITLVLYTCLLIRCNISARSI